MRIAFLFLIGVCLQSCHREAATVSGRWIENPPAVNGDLSDWGHSLEPDTKDEFGCWIANDAEYIYLGMRLQDPQLQARAMLMGMTIWIDTTGKQKNHRGVAFPLAPSDAQWNEWATQAKGDKIALENRYADYCQEFDLLGFVEEPLRVSNLTSRDMKVSARFDAVRALIYELKIPIRQIVQRSDWQGAVIAAQVKINEPKATIDNDSGTFNDPNATSITQSNPMMGGGGMNGMNGGMNGGMNNPNMVGNPNQRYSAPRGNYTPTVWVKAQLIVGTGNQNQSSNTMKRVIKTEDEWRQQLDPLAYSVLRQAGTERPFTGKFYEHSAVGTYSCAACGHPLFDSENKYHSGCGWPSFWGELETADIKQRQDISHGMVRVELLCPACDSHLGHIFDDGPADKGGKRYCINSVCLNFTPK